MTDEELKVLAVDIVDEKVFGSWMIPKDQPALIANIFMPLVVKETTSKLPDDVSCLYEYLDKALPMSIDGFPTFFSFKFLTNDDRERLTPMIQRYKSMKQPMIDHYNSIKQEFLDVCNPACGDVDGASQDGPSQHLGADQN